jgi:cytochrome c6
MPDHARAQLQCARLALAFALVVSSLPAMAGEKADIELGRQVFTELAQPNCGICHTLDDAGTTGTIAPNLDRLQPSEERVQTAVRMGPGAMPDYSGRLSDEEIDALAAYVAHAAAQP